MIDPVSTNLAAAPALARTAAPRTDVAPVAPPAPVVAAAAASSGSSDASQQEADRQAPPPKRQQLAIDVQKADDGVFVYTLSDPDTHAVIVVIPRKNVDGSQEGHAVDKRV